MLNGKNGYQKCHVQLYFSGPDRCHVDQFWWAVQSESLDMKFLEYSRAPLELQPSQMHSEPRYPIICENDDDERLGP